MKLQLVWIILIGALSVTACNQSTSQSASKTDSLTQSSQAQTTKPVTGIAALAKKEFDNYARTLEDSDKILDYTKVFTGDFTGDNQNDAVIFYSMAPRDGGNMVVEEGLVLYKGDGNKVQFLMKYNPKYSAYCDTIKNGKIYLWKTEYKPDDPRCCPSIKHSIELSYTNNKISEKKIGK